mmetsp:Transcript_34224/g.98683  ORF Transcript_34224/g.98683 Transcript_34224/m.98683 type:complete len:206 (+) Transcript_34224:150-767(+)
MMSALPPKTTTYRLRVDGRVQPVSRRLGNKLTRIALRAVRARIGRRGQTPRWKTSSPKSCSMSLASARTRCRARRPFFRCASAPGASASVTKTFLFTRRCASLQMSTKKPWSSSTIATMLSGRLRCPWTRSLVLSAWRNCCNGARCRDYARSAGCPPYMFTSTMRFSMCCSAWRTTGGRPCRRPSSCSATTLPVCSTVNARWVCC